MISWARFVIVVGLLAGTAAFLQVRNKGEALPARQPLSGFPVILGEWGGTDLFLDEQTRRVLGDGDFLSRLYRSTSQPYLDLFVAYFPTQRTGSTIHSPQNCLPAAGWAPLEHSRIALRGADGRPAIVNRYVIAKGTDRQVVLYWYQSNGRVVASEYWAKIYLVVDSVRRNRSDGALVRVVTPKLQDEALESADNRARSFAELVLAKMDPYVPR